MPAPAVALEPLAVGHAAAVQALASDPEVARTTAIPHPYPAGAALAFVQHARQARAQGIEYHYAILHERQCVGLCGIKQIEPTRRAGEVGYWVGRDYWGRGIAPAALRALLDIATRDLRLRLVTAITLETNSRSIRVLEKVGFYHVRRELNQGRVGHEPGAMVLCFELPLEPPRTQPGP